MKFEKITPSVFYVTLQDSFKLFIDCLEFKITHQELEIENPYCVVENDTIGILIFQNKEYAAIIKPELRIVTKDIESVYHKVTATCPELLHPNLNKVTLRPWGAKEFALFDGQVCFIIQEW